MMVFERITVTVVSEDENRHVSYVQTMIERAIADGYLSRVERDDIMTRIYSNHHVSPDECRLMRALQEKVWSGEIYIGD